MAINEGWEEKKLSALCNLANGYAFKPSDWGNLGKPIIRIQNLNGGQDFNFFNGILPERYVIEPGTLLFAWSGNRGTSFGPFVWKGQSGFLNQHIFKVTPKEGIDENWFFFALDDVRQKVERNAHGAIGLVHVRKQDLCEYVVLKPKEIGEQKAIAAILDTMDEAIRRTEALIAKLRQVKAGMLHDLLTRGLDEKGDFRDPLLHPEQFKDSSLGKIPIEWEIQFLDDLTLKIVDGIHHTPKYVDSGVPFIVVSNLTSGDGISFENSRFISQRDHLKFISRANPRPGDVLVTKDGTLGVARVVPTDAPDFSIFVSVAMLRPNPKKCYSELICSFFDSGEFYVQLGALSAGSGLVHIHLEHFRKFRIRLPPIDEQDRIFKVLAGQDNLLKIEVDNLHKLILLRRGLTQDLVHGQVRVPESMLQKYQPESQAM